MRWRSCGLGMLPGLVSLPLQLLLGDPARVIGTQTCSMGQSAECSQPLPLPLPPIATQRNAGAAASADACRRLNAAALPAAGRHIEEERITLERLNFCARCELEDARLDQNTTPGEG